MSDIKLIVSDKNIPLNDLMKDMLANLVLAFLKSAKGIPEDFKKVQIEINL
ncbi:MAG: hypothetical protein ACFFAO_06710 [Candidatus Hermodarchaeota archaeon]